MNKRQLSNRSTLLLMELILAILFFAVISAICLQVFARSHQMQQQAREQDFAVSACTSVSEVLSAYPEDADDPEQMWNDMTSVLQEGSVEGDGYVIFYADDFTATDSEEADYRLTITPAGKEGGCATYVICMSDFEGDLYSLDCVLHAPVKEVS